MDKQHIQPVIGDIVWQWSMSTATANMIIIIVANLNDVTFGSFFNVSNGTFTAQTTYSTGPTPCSSVVIDVDSDSKLDIAVADQVNGSFNVLSARWN